MARTLHGPATLGTAHSPGTHFQVLAPMLEPCKLRWVRYNDYYTGQELLGACLASFELESSGAQTFACRSAAQTSEVRPPGPSPPQRKA